MPGWTTRGSSMNCRRARHLFVMEGICAYGTRRAARLSGHLARCPRCRREVDRFDRDGRLIRAAFLTLPLRPDFTEAVMRRIRGWR